MLRLETDEEKDFAKRLKKEYNLRAIKFTNSSQRGAPDRLVLLPGGRSLFIEFKRRGETPREEQLNYHKWLGSLEHKVVVCYTAREAVAHVAKEMQNDRKAFEDDGTTDIVDRM